MSSKVTRTCEGVKVKCFKRFEYSLDEAYQYALNSEHRDDLIYIDKKKFDRYYSKMLEVGMDLPFVNIVVEPVPYIARDLDRALHD